jgi:hypothetical protein
MPIPRPKNVIDVFTYLLAWFTIHLSRSRGKRMIFPQIATYRRFTARHFIRVSLALKTQAHAFMGKQMFLCPQIMPGVVS